MKIGVDGRLIGQTGVGRYTQNLFDALKEIKKQYHIELFKPKIPWHSVSEQILLPFYLIFRHYDLVHFTYFSLPVLYPGKFVITIHDLIPWKHKTGKASTLPAWLYSCKYLLYRLVIWIGAHRACKIITVSRETKNDIINILNVNTDKISVIYEAVDKQFLSGNIIGGGEKPRFDKYLLYVGNAYPHKNLDFLIDVISDVDKLKLVLVGPDDYFYARLKKDIGKRKLRDKVVFYEQAKDEELAGLYRNAAAYVSPSIAEGFGLPGLEAMACRCPVICSNIGVFKEIYGNAALYFDPFDKKDIKSKIIEAGLMSDDKRKELTTRGLEKAAQYSWEKCAGQTLAVYESCFSL